MVDQHFKGVFFLTQALLADGARIINLSSGLSRFTAPGYAAYASAKGAVDVLTRYLALELGARDITVNAFAPGPDRHRLRRRAGARTSTFKPCWPARPPSAESGSPTTSDRRSPR